MLLPLSRVEGVVLSDDDSCEVDTPMVIFGAVQEIQRGLREVDAYAQLRIPLLLKQDLVLLRAVVQLELLDFVVPSKLSQGL